MVQKTEDYVDTSALIAFLDRSDTHHALFRRLFSDPPALITTVLVVAEGHGWFLRRFDGTRAMQFLSLIEDMKPLRVLGVNTSQKTGGVEMIRRFSDQNLTLADAVGLHLIEERSIDTCWSTDFHLGLTGATLAIHKL